MASADYLDPPQSCPSGTAVVDLYLIPSGRRLVSSTLVVANVSGSTATYDVAVRPAGAALAAQHYLAKNAPGNNDGTSGLKAGQSDFLTVGITGQAGTVITVRSSVASALSFSLFGTVITP